MIPTELLLAELRARGIGEASFLSLDDILKELGARYLGVVLILKSSNNIFLHQQHLQPWDALGLLEYCKKYLIKPGQNIPNSPLPDQEQI